MKILLDENLPKDLQSEFGNHDVKTVTAMGWSGTKNGALLRLAEAEFEVFVTADRNFIYQQNLRNTTLIFVVLQVRNTRLDSLTPLIPEVLQRLQGATAGDVIMVSSPVDDDN
jgi:predicted nuclease of predicted toxin-antitoxin system